MARRLHWQIVVILSGALIGYLAASGRPILDRAAHAADDASAPGKAPPAGSPAATRTISGKQLPPPDPAFGGVIKDSAQQSKYWWPPRIVPPAKAPNPAPKPAVVVKMDEPTKKAVEKALKKAAGG